MADVDRESLFEGLVEDYMERIYNLCYYMTGEPEVARELTQESFLRAYKALDRFRGESSHYTWLYKIALNRCRTYLKKRGKERNVSLDELEDAGWDPAEDPPDNMLEIMTVRKALASLPPEHREILLLFYFDELKYEEIAEALDIPMGTVKSRLARAKSALKEAIGDEP
ncbi:MAG: RNA polymerase sigma factor [candidate division WOR-3 bacterium]